MSLGRFFFGRFEAAHLAALSFTCFAAKLVGGLSLPAIKIQKIRKNGMPIDRTKLLRRLPLQVP